MSIEECDVKSRILKTRVLTLNADDPPPKAGLRSAHLTRTCTPMTIHLPLSSLVPNRTRVHRLEHIFVRNIVSTMTNTWTGRCVRGLRHSVLVGMVLTGTALAQEAPPTQPAPEAQAPQAQPTASKARLPELIQQAPATYPAQALARGESGVVVMILDISQTGQVMAVEIKTSAGAEFDEAAALAARGFQFAPATDEGGTPAASRIEYAYQFTADQAAPISVEGRVREAGVRTLIANAEVRAVGPDGQNIYGKTSEEGRFEMAGLSPGEWTLVFSARARMDETAKVTVEAGKVQSVDVYLLRDEVRAGSEVDEVVEITAVKAGAEISERTLSSKEIRYLPGTNGDVVRVVQNLPGVARAPLGTGQLRIRGTAPEDSLYFLDGARIPIVFHFSGLSTVISSNLLAEVGYFPGNYCQEVQN